MTLALEAPGQAGVSRCAQRGRGFLLASRGGKATVASGYGWGTHGQGQRHRPSTLPVLQGPALWSVHIDQTGESTETQTGAKAPGGTP